MDTVITMVVVIEHNQDVTDIIETKAITIGTEGIETDQLPITIEITDITRTADITKIQDTTITLGITRVTITEQQGHEIPVERVRPDHVQQDVIKSVSSPLLGRGVQIAIISNTFPTINPPNVPTIYPIIAISTPMGISALE